MMRGKEELVELCSQLRGEKLIVSSEIDQICRLNNDVVECLNQLMQTAWISCKQQLTVNKLMHPGANPLTPQGSCRQIQTLENTQFIESYKKLNGHDLNVRQLMQILLSDSSLLASLLNFADSCNENQCHPCDPEDLCHSLFSGLYGCCIFGSDEKLVADTLLNLMRLQLVTNQDPRRLLRRGNCSFSRLYKLFNENMFAAKVFLTCALHEPIMDVLSMDDAFLDIDPNKIMERFSAQEKLERFGEEGSTKFRENLNQYRKMVVNKLFKLSQKFISSLKSSLHCFPPVISLLVRRLIDMLLTRQEMESSEDHFKENASIQASLISIDLIFTYFICPAIAKPESLAIITDTPISSIARHNLMQIGQILQSLAFSSYEKLDSKCADLFSQFEPTCVSNIVQTFTATNGSSYMTLDELYASGDATNCNLNLGRPSIARQIALVTVDDVDLLIKFLREYMTSGRCEIAGAWKEVYDLLSKLPERFSSYTCNGNAMQVDSSSPTNAIRKTLKLPRPNSRTFNLPQSSGDKLVYILQKDISPSQQQTFKDENPPAEVLIVHLSDNITPLQMEFLSEESFLTSIKSSGSIRNEGSTMPSDRSVEKRTRFDLESLG
uniref:Ras-GAP domain-containing protein n=1 Tax=Romanomermis culicivorax TaxID=13658 RepID=A0A915IS73_ROMCU